MDLVDEALEVRDVFEHLGTEHRVEVSRRGTGCARRRTGRSRRSRSRSGRRRGCRCPRSASCARRAGSGTGSDRTRRRARRPGSEEAPVAGRGTRSRSADRRTSGRRTSPCPRASSAGVFDTGRNDSVFNWPTSARGADGLGRRCTPPRGRGSGGGMSRFRRAAVRSVDTHADEAARGAALGDDLAERSNRCPPLLTCASTVTAR